MATVRDIQDIGFILGFIAGEGSFNANLHQQDTYKFGVYAGLRFHIGLHQNDKQLLYSLKEYFDMGRVVERQNNGYDSVYWEVKKNDEIKQLCDWIEENKSDWFEESIKHKSYKKWKYLVENRQQLISTYDGMVEFIELAKDINRDSRGKSVSEWISRLEEPKDL